MYVSRKFHPHEYPLSLDLPVEILPSYKLQSYFRTQMKSLAFSLTARQSNRDGIEIAKQRSLAHSWDGEKDGVVDCP